MVAGFCKGIGRGAAYVSDNSGTGGRTSFSRPLKSRMKPLFLCFKGLLEPTVTVGEETGSESRLSTFAGPGLILVKTCFARIPALIDRALVLVVIGDAASATLPVSSELGKATGGIDVCMAG